MQRATATSEEGQALVEYALIIGLIAIFAVGSLTILGQNVDGALNLVASKFDAIP
jgi:Flp pilus assembly pilin Flp